MELNQEEIILCINSIEKSLNEQPNNTPSLFDLIRKFKNFLEDKKEKEEKEEITKRYIEIIIYELKKKYADLDVYYEKDDYQYLIVIENCNYFYSKEFTTFLGYLDYQYLL